MITREFWQGDYGTKARRERCREEMSARGRHGKSSNNVVGLSLPAQTRQQYLNKWRSRA